VPQFSSSDTNPRQVCEPTFGKRRADTEKGEQTLGDDEELPACSVGWWLMAGADLF
jgi:hypothetical protein